MNLTYVALDLRRNLRDAGTLIFTIGMPTLMYVLFGASSPGGDLALGHGNVKFYIMSSMAAYGAATGVVSTTGVAAAESMLGWGRQLGLTRQKPLGFVADKVALATMIALATQAVLYVVGAATGAKADAHVWVLAFLISLLGSSIFAAFGLFAATWFRSEVAVSVASMLIVVFSFFGNVFMPLTGVMLKIAHFTPMYGYVSLVRWPQQEGWLVSMGETPSLRDPLWQVLGSVIAWGVIFVLLALAGLRRSRTRR